MTVQVTEPAGPTPPPPDATEAATPPGARRALDWARKFELVSVIIVALLSPLIAGAGIWYSNSQIREQLRITSEGQITDRYNKAVENLGDDAMDVRLGGIYALQRIMEDSPRDQPTVANVLATYIRTHTAKPPKKSEEVAGDVHAALTVLAYRDHTRDGTFALDLRGTHLPGIELPPLSDGTPADLTDATLANADLTGANLDGADLTGANLSGADLSGAGLVGVDLTDVGLIGGANLTGVDLAGMDLAGMDLRGVNLTHASLHSADLTDANLIRANLRSADLRSANLTGAANLTVQQLLSAIIDRSTKLPARIAKDPAIKARIAEYE